MKVREIRQALNKEKPVGAWRKGVVDYAFLITDGFDADDDITSEKELLNGARDWHAYSWGGCALIYDKDIACLLCAPSEARRKKYGELPPNSREQWLDVQARALTQAAMLVMRIINK